MGLVFKSCLLSVLFLSLSTAQAQQTKAYIEMEPGFFSVPVLIVNDKPTGYWDMDEAMKDNPQAYEYAQKYESYALWGNVALWGGLLGGLGYLIAESSRDGGFDDDRFNSGAYYGLLLGGLVVGGTLLQRSQSYFYKAINTYNGVGMKASASYINVSVHPQKDGGGLSFIYSF